MVRPRPRLVLALLVLTAGAVAAAVPVSGAPPRTNTIILSGNGVGAGHFGEGQRAAASSLVKLIGKSVGGVRKQNEGDCIVSAALFWSNFAAYFYRGRFDGYQTGHYGTGTSEPAFNGATPQGLRVGDSLATARRLYGSAISTSGVQGGVYAVDTKGGTIRGYLSIEPNQALATKVRVLSISAGSVGCPAMSPG